MRQTVIGWVLVGMTLAAPSAAQHGRRPLSERPPHAGTPLVCCTGWTVSVVSGWPLPYDGPPQQAYTFPASWPVLTIVAMPDAPTANTCWCSVASVGCILARITARRNALIRLYASMAKPSAASVA